MKWVLALLLLIACGPKRDRIVFDDYSLTLVQRSEAVAQINSWTEGGYRQYQFRVERFPIMFTRPVFGIDVDRWATEAASFTDLDNHVVYLTSRTINGQFIVQDLPWELSQIRRWSR